MEIRQPPGGNDPRWREVVLPAEIVVAVLELAATHDPDTARAVALVCRWWNAAHGSLRALRDLRRRAAPGLYADLLLKIAKDSDMPLKAADSVGKVRSAAAPGYFWLAGHYINRAQARRRIARTFAACPAQTPVLGPHVILSNAHVVAAALCPLLVDVGGSEGRVIPFALAFGRHAHHTASQRGLLEWLSAALDAGYGYIGMVSCDIWTDSVSDPATFVALWRFLRSN